MSAHTSGPAVRTSPVLRALMAQAEARRTSHVFESDDQAASIGVEIGRLLARTGLSEPQLDHLRYKPDTSLVARVSGLPDAGADAQPWWFAAYSPAQQDKVRKLRTKAEDTGFPLATAELSAVPGLQVMCGPIGLDKRLLKPLATSGLVSAAGQPRGEVLSYNPWRRLVIRRNSESALEAPTADLVMRVWAQAPTSVGAWSVLYEHGVPVLPIRQINNTCVEQPWVSGGDLAARLSTGDTGVSMGAVAESLARLHRAEAPDIELPAVDIDVALNCAQTGVAGVFPEYLSDFGAAAATVRAALKSDVSMVGPVHGDFSSDQVVLGPDGVPTLIDLDRLSRAPVGYDLGSFAAFELLSERAVNPVLELVEEYAAIAGSSHRDHEETLNAWTALHILLRVLEPFRRLEPESAERVRERIALAQRLVGGTTAVGSVSRSG